MNTELIPQIVTPQDYFQILNKEENLTPKERSQKMLFENFIANCEKNRNLLSPAVEDVYLEYQKELEKLYNNSNLVKKEKQNIINFDLRKEEQKEYTRKLTNKAGYINATIILVMILNIGFIIAMALLGNK